MRKNKIKQFLYYLLAFTAVFAIAGSASADYLAKQDNVGGTTISTYINADYVNSPLPPNTSVTLTFTIQITNCQNGQQIYAYLKHWTSAQSVDYIAKGSKSSFTQNFNSGSPGQGNQYASAFVCETGGIAGTDYAGGISNLKSNGLAWESFPLSMTTSAATAKPQITFSPPLPSNQTYAPNTTISIAGQNMPAGLGATGCGQGTNPNYIMTVKLNTNAAVRFYCFPYPFLISSGAVEGAIDMNGGLNSLAVTVADTSGNTLALSSLSFKVGQPSTGTTSGGTGNQTGGTQSGDTIDCSKNPDPNKCLYNPIPNQNDITSLLVTIMKGFLGIVAVWAVAFIVIGGFRMIISQGNEEAVAAAKKTIQWAVLGLVVAILSFVIIAVVQNFIGVDVQPVTTTFINKIYNGV